ncbi:hypothetical protein AA0117_g8584 [Alternaria alternata]|uniref:Borealin N-terminal domain-containing protein n=1 Tax=Alternaria alternata TaxID=5599 RepID=A0A4Q4NB59_ALTAL|nr:hypothetical protein AA0117_g8584 [Alternaria alternata]
MNNIQDGLTAEAKANMLANLQLEINSRKEKLRAQCDVQCASLQSRLERRVNRIPTVTRQTTLLDLLKASAPAQPVAAPAPATKTTVTKKTSAPAPAPATRKTRTAPPTNPSSSAAATSSPDNRRVKTAPKTTKPTPSYAKATQTTRTKKRSSDEMSGTDKENAEMQVPKKRTRAPVQKPASAAPTTRATRAASRTKTTKSHVLSPKTNTANVKKPAARSARPR